MDATALAVVLLTVSFGLVFQNYALFDHMAVGENLGFGLRVRGSPQSQIDKRVTELLQLIQLPDLRRRFPADLSGGQRQRAAFARALAVGPNVLLLDEPSGALDVKVRVELREWLRRLHDEVRVTTLLVTDDQLDAFEVAEHVIVLLDDKVAQASAPHDIYDRPATPRVAQFIGGGNVLANGAQSECAKAAIRNSAFPSAAEQGSKSKCLYVHMMSDSPSRPRILPQRI